LYVTRVIEQISGRRINKPMRYKRENWDWKNEKQKMNCNLKAMYF